MMRSYFSITKKSVPSLDQIELIVNKKSTISFMLELCDNIIYAEKEVRLWNSVENMTFSISGIEIVEIILSTSNIEIWNYHIIISTILEIGKRNGEMYL